MYVSVVCMAKDNRLLVCRDCCHAEVVSLYSSWSWKSQVRSLGWRTNNEKTVTCRRCLQHIPEGVQWRVDMLERSAREYIRLTPFFRIMKHRSREDFQGKVRSLTHEWCVGHGVDGERLESGSRQESRARTVEIYKKRGYVVGRWCEKPSITNPHFWEGSTTDPVLVEYALFIGMPVVDIDFWEACNERSKNRNHRFMHLKKTKGRRHSRRKRKQMVS